MGAGVNTGETLARRRGRRRRAMAPMAEINVTPFVDVMLVLLIIFMVTAPLLTAGVPIELPKSDATPIADAPQKEPLIISVEQNGGIFLQETEITLDEIGAKLAAIAQTAPQQTIYVRGDARANYGVLMQVMGKISAAGFQRISLVTDLQERN